MAIEENHDFIGDDDLQCNTSSRIPVCLCLDVSGSMEKNDAISALNEGVTAFYDAIRSDDQAKASCEISVITFSSKVDVVEEFSTVDKKEKVHFTANGGTALAHGVIKALNLLEDRKQHYKDNGVDYFQPWLVIITDGKPGDQNDIPAAQLRCKQLMDEKKLTIFPIAVGSDENETKFHEIMDVLNGFCDKPKALHLKDLKFNDLFEWLGKSVSTISASSVGEKVTLDTQNLVDWGEL